MSKMVATVMIKKGKKRRGGEGWNDWIAKSKRLRIVTTQEWETPSRQRFIPIQERRVTSEARVKIEMPALRQTKSQTNPRLMIDTNPER